MGPFTLNARYSEPENIPTMDDPNIGTFHVNKVTPTPEGESSKVKVKVKINTHGIFDISQASLVEKVETKDEPMEEEKPATTESTEGAATGDAKTTDNGPQEPMKTDETPK